MALQKCFCNSKYNTQHNNVFKTLNEANINSPHRFFIEAFILVSGAYQEERNGQIFEAKVPRTYIASWKTLSQGNYPALAHDEDKIILPFIFVYNK